MTDSGNYSCLAKNHFGVDKITYALEVKCEKKLIITNIVVR